MPGIIGCVGGSTGDNVGGLENFAGLIGAALGGEVTGCRVGSGPLVGTGDDEPAATTGSATVVSMGAFNLSAMLIPGLDSPEHR